MTFQLPFSAEAPTVSLVVATPYGRSASVAMPVSTVQPGIFPDRVSGFESDSGASTSQIPRAGGMLAVHCTGLGAVSPAGRTGRPADDETPQLVVASTEAWVDNRRVDVTSSGLSTSEAGVYVVIVNLPADLTAGQHAIQIAAGGVRSNTVAFQSE